MTTKTTTTTGTGTGTGTETGKVKCSICGKWIKEGSDCGRRCNRLSQGLEMLHGPFNCVSIPDGYRLMSKLHADADAVGKKGFVASFGSDKGTGTAIALGFVPIWFGHVRYLDSKTVESWIAGTKLTPQTKIRILKSLRKSEVSENSIAEMLEWIGTPELKSEVKIA